MTKNVFSKKSQKNHKTKKTRETREILFTFLLKSANLPSFWRIFWQKMFLHRNRNLLEFVEKSSNWREICTYYQEYKQTLTIFMKWDNFVTFSNDMHAQLFLETVTNASHRGTASFSPFWPGGRHQICFGYPSLTWGAFHP